MNALYGILSKDVCGSRRLDTPLVNVNVYLVYNESFSVREFRVDAHI